LDFNFRKMDFLKRVVFLLLIPVVTHGQTVHVDSNRIVYKGTVKPGPVNKDELYARARNALFSNVKEGKGSNVTANNKDGIISAKGSVKLASPYHIIKTIEYILELSVGDGKYEYRIDSVYLKQVERGGKTTRISSEELLKGMDVSGAGSAAAEEQLNEIDMNFQKLIDLVNSFMKTALVMKSSQ